jgi:hypothetical protein
MCNLPLITALLLQLLLVQVIQQAQAQAHNQVLTASPPAVGHLLHLCVCALPAAQSTQAVLARQGQTQLPTMTANNINSCQPPQLVGSCPSGLHWPT